jgi:hypothetical protein
VDVICDLISDVNYVELGIGTAMTRLFPRGDSSTTFRDENGAGVISRPETWDEEYRTFASVTAICTLQPK